MAGGKGPKKPERKAAKVLETRAGQFVLEAAHPLVNIQVAAELLPDMVRVARKRHKTDAEVRTAVLLSWTGLAGVVGWCPGMVAAVEAEMAR